MIQPYQLNLIQKKHETVTESYFLIVKGLNKSEMIEYYNFLFTVHPRDWHLLISEKMSFDPDPSWLGTPWLAD